MSFINCLCRNASVGTCPVNHNPLRPPRGQQGMVVVTWNTVAGRITAPRSVGLDSSGSTCPVAMDKASKVKLLMPLMLNRTMTLPLRSAQQR